MAGERQSAGVPIESSIGAISFTGRKVSKVKNTHEVQEKEDNRMEGEGWGQPF